MWYLIIPPFIIIFSLGALLWFLSRRMSESDIADALSSLRESTLTESHSRSLSRKAFFLKVLEVLASRFKTATLRIHNFFQHSLERLRRQRTEIDSIRKNLVEESDGVMSKDTGTAAPESVNRPSDERSPKEFLEDALMLRRRSSTTVPTAESVSGLPSPVAGSRPSSAGPMLRERVTRPERTAVQPPQAGQREESLIARIVENPRDAVAYEELGDCYFMASNLQDAKECYRQALKLHPTNRAVKIKIRRLEKVFEERNR
ncbi:MAG TPA: tetratricopeptide repeat protein [Candidatus Fimivivens sp.]|nr:tetratricopeptide repeat protein [Candidatus Fimivivens sp.]